MKSELSVFITKENALLAISINPLTDAIELSREDVMRLKKRLKIIDINKITSNEEYRTGKFKMFCNFCCKEDLNTKMIQYDDVSLCKQCDKILKKKFPKKEDFDNFLTTL